MKNVVHIAFLAIFCALSTTQVRGQDAPVLQCLEVGSDGSVEITWLPPSASEGFQSYRVFYSPNGITFNEVADIPNVSQTSYQHAGAQAGLGSRSYFVTAEYLQGNGVSDTLQTIFLQLDNFNFSEARLYWNVLGDPLPAGTSPTIEIFKEYPLGNWNLHATVSDTIAFSEAVVVCNDSINYRLEIANNSGCRSVSNISGAWFRIIEEPAKPLIDSISITANGRITLGWEPVGNALAYIIYRFDAGIWNPVDTVYGAGNTSYTDLSSEPCGRSLTYSVATIDTCGSSGPKDENELRKSLLIGQADYDACAEQVDLQWNAYRGPEADSYDVWVSKDNGPYELLSVDMLTDTFFVHTIPEVGSTYSYFVRARFSTGTSTSCPVQVDSYSYTKPSFVYLANADVLPAGNIRLTILPDTVVGKCTWQIYREGPEDNAGILIGELDSDGNTTYPLRFDDETADPAAGQYHYTVEVLDSCGRQVITSTPAGTIYLTAGSLSVNQNRLEWTPYEGWDMGVRKYYVYRSFGDDPQGQVIDSTDASILQFVDDLSGFSNYSGVPVYWIEAAEHPGGTYNLQMTARSNRVSVVKESDMYLPNAFRPDGSTPVFKPIFRFYNGKYYRFRIFSRWGSLLFETGDPEEGWDGKIDGSPVPTGTYVYFLQYETLDGETVLQRGTVTVIY